MVNKDRVRNIVLLILFAISALFGIVNGSYLITAMYILTVAAVVFFLFRDSELYSVLYGVLMVSAFYDYVLYVPGIQSIYMFHIMLGVFTLISLYKVVSKRELFRELDKNILIIYAIWFVYMCISVIWALNKSLAIKYIAIYLMMFSFVINMMIYNINKERIKQTINLFLFLISLIVVVGAIEVALGQQLPVRHYYDGNDLSELHRNMLQARAIVFSFNTNNLAATIAILSPICLFGIYRFQNILIKIWLTIVNCAGFSLIIITTSRTGVFAIYFAFAVFVIYSIARIRTLKAQALIFPIILCLSFVFLYYNSAKFEHIKPVDGKNVVDTGLMDKMNELNDSEYEQGGSGSLNERRTIINNVLTGTIKEKHYLGYGVGNVEQYIRNIGNTRGVYSPHCYPIEILGDFGLPGVALYGIYYLYLLIQNLIIGIKKKSLMCFAAVGGLIAFAPACFGPSSITYVFSYWMLMGFSIACIQVYKQEDTSYNRTSSIKEFRSI